jgi:hypothetical protein
LGTPADTIRTKTIKIIQKKEGPDSTITETIMTPENSTSEELSNVLIIIDGVEHKEKDAMLVVDPVNIEKVDVFKDKARLNSTLIFIQFG